MGRAMRNRGATRAVRELAERQHGVVARWQLVELGLSDGMIQQRIAGGMLIPVLHGTFTLGHRHLTQEGHWMVAVLASGRGAVLSHESAMALWGIRAARRPVEVLRRSGGVWRPRQGLRLHQTRSLPAEHVTAKTGIPVTTVERTFLDMAGRLSVRQHERALVDADRDDLIRWPELQRLVRGWRGKRGIGRLRLAAMELDPRATDTKSPLEVDFLALCREFGLPSPEVNVIVAGYEIDFFWPQQRVVVETDGYSFHRDRRAFEEDHKRTVALTAAGYEVHRATYRMLAWDPDPFMNLVRRRLRRTASNSSSGGAGI